MEQGIEEVVAIADLPGHAGKLVQGLGKRTLVATKRQALPEEQSSASTSDRHASSPQAEARQASATLRQPDGQSQGLQHASKQQKQAQQKSKAPSDVESITLQDNGLASLADESGPKRNGNVLQQLTESLSLRNMANECDKAA